MTDFITGGPTRYAHQVAGLRKMISTGGVTALLMEPGTGKTCVVIDYAALLAIKSPRREARILVVCPLAAIDTWVTQTEQFISPQVNYWAEAIGGSIAGRAQTLAARGGQPFGDTDTPKSRKALKTAPRALHVRQSVAWSARGSASRTAPVTRSEGPDGLGDDLPRVVLIATNLDTFSSRSMVGSKTMADRMLAAVRRFDPDLVVMDEMHLIKGPQSNASRLLGRISKEVPRRAGLTGTVMPHSPLDVFAQWRFLDPYAFGSTKDDGSARQATFGRFRDRFAIMGGFQGRQAIGFQNLDDMQQIMAVNSIVVRKKDALDLPDTTDVIVPVDLTAKEQRAYDEMKKQLAAILAPNVAATVPNKLVMMMRLRQITAGYLKDDQGTTHDLGGSKVRTIRSLVNETLIGEKRVVVFALFTHEIDMLAKALAVKGTEIMTIGGSTQATDRMALRRRFGSDDPKRMVMIAQIKTMSLAVNELVTASHMVFASLSLQRDEITQARDRLHRIGQTKPVTFWMCLAPKSVDTVIWQSFIDRTNLEKAMLDHVRQINS